MTRRFNLLFLVALLGVAALFVFPSGTSPRQAEAFLFPTASISNVTPRFGPTSGGTYDGGPNGIVTIQGSGFSSINGLRFGSDPLMDCSSSSTNCTVVNDNTIQVVPPAHGAAEGVGIQLSVPGGLFTTTCLVIQAGCSNAYFYMEQSDINVSLPVGVVFPHTTETFSGDGWALELSQQLDELDGPLTISGHVRTAKNLGIPSAFESDLNVSIPNLQLTLAFEGRGEIDKVFPYYVLVPNFAIAGVHVNASVSAGVQIQPTLKGLTGHLRASYVNGVFSQDTSARCNGHGISLANIGDCVFVQPSVEGQVSVVVDPVWVQLGEKNILGTGVNMKAAVSLLSAGIAGGLDSSLPGGIWGDACWSLLHWEWELKLPNIFGGTDFELGQDGNLLGPWNVGVYPSGNVGAADNCPLGPVMGWSGNGPTSGGWSGGTPPPPPGGGADGNEPIDTTPPIITVQVSPAPNGNGWNNGDVVVDWSVSDPESGIASTSGCSDMLLTAETGGIRPTCTATNRVGLTSTLSTPWIIRIDRTSPSTLATLTPATPNGERGWYVSDLTFTLDPQDPLLSNGDLGSGIQYTEWRLNGAASWQDYKGPFTIGDEGWNTLEWYSVDNADNVEATHEFRFKLDKTRPDISISSGTIDDIVWDQVHLERGILTNQNLLALVGNATDNLCLWEARAVDVDSGQTLASQQPVGANTPDWPPPYPPNSLAYSLNVPLHTGINTIDIIAEDCAGWEDAIRIQVVYVVPGPFDPRSKGFWYNAVGTGKYTNAQIQTFLSYINVASDVWGNDPSRNRYGPLTLANYRSILGVPDSANMELKMKAQLLGDWLNMVSGRLAIKKAVNVSSVARWPLVMDDIGGNPLTFAYKVTLEIEEKVQPAPAPFDVNAVAKELAEGINTRAIILP